MLHYVLCFYVIYISQIICLFFVRNIFLLIIWYIFYLIHTVLLNFFTPLFLYKFFRCILAFYMIYVNLNTVYLRGIKLQFIFIFLVFVLKFV